MIWICTVGAALEIAAFCYIAVKVNNDRDRQKDIFREISRTNDKLDGIKKQLSDLKSEMADAKEDESKQAKMDEGFANMMAYDPTNVGLKV